MIWAVFLEPSGSLRILMAMNSATYPLLACLCLSQLACAATSTGVLQRDPMLVAESGVPLPAPKRTHSFSARAPSDSAEARRLRERIARAAGHAVGHREMVVGNERFRFDCSGITRGIYADAGFRLGGHARSPTENDVSILYRLAKEQGSLRKTDPLPGDLVFFDDTYDRNHDGKRNDPLSHVGVVEKVLPDGTVVLVHRVGGGILRYRMNLAHKNERRDPVTGATWNHFLRRAEGGVPAKTTADLFVAFGTVALSPQARPLVASR